MLKRKNSWKGILFKKIPKKLILAGISLLFFSFFILLPTHLALADNLQAYISLQADTPSYFYVDGRQIMLGEFDTDGKLKPRDSNYTCISDSTNKTHTLKAVPADTTNFQTREQTVTIEKWGNELSCLDNPENVVSFTLNKNAPVTAPIPAPAAGSAPSSSSIAGESAIRGALRTGGNEHSGWVIASWKIVLGLANLGLVVILIFLAVVNILRIQYDTYAIKKSLPILIIGIILANFSLLIVRMLVDFSNILTNLFTNNQSPGEFAAQLIAGAGDRLAPGGGIAKDFASGGIGLGSLLIWFLFALFVMVAFLILGFLFYIRFAVVLILAIVAPLAFVAMAFPPTQGFFKQWWGWLTKFIFMKPIVFFLLYLAMKIRTAEGAMGHLTAWFIVAFLVYAAIIIPFKLGGVVMSAWGGVGKKAANLGKRGFMKATEIPRAKLGNWAMKTPIGRYMRGRQLELETLKAEREGIMAGHEKAIRKKKGSKQTLREREVEYAKGELEAEKMAQTLDVETGKFNHISKRQMRKITGRSDPMDVAQKYVEQANRLTQMQEGLTKRRDLDLQNLSIRDLRADNKFRGQLTSLTDRVEADFDESGNRLAVGAARTQITYDRAIEVAEELRFKAKSETDDTRRAELLEAAKQFDTRAQNFRGTHQRDIAGNKIEYDAYLGRNLAGRRHRIINPAVDDEAKTQVLTQNHTALVTDTEVGKTFGTSEWRARGEDYDKFLKGEINKVDPTAAYACLVQAQAQKQVMDTARRGELKGLETMKLFTDRVQSARGGTYKIDTTNAALATMDEKTRSQFQAEIARQHLISTGVMTQAGWDALNSDQKLAQFGALSATDQASAIGNLDYLQFEIKGNTPEAVANRNFVDRFLTQVELDDKLGLSKGSGAMLSKT